MFFSSFLSTLSVAKRLINKTGTYILNDPSSRLSPNFYSFPPIIQAVGTNIYWLYQGLCPRI